MTTQWGKSVGASAVLAVCLALTACSQNSSTATQEAPSPPASVTPATAPTTPKEVASSKLRARIETNYGDIVVKFYPDVAPNHVNNFVKLARDGFYDGLTFHRIIEGFMIQGGDPQGTGMGGPGYKIKAEFNERKHVEGTLAMARSSDPNSAGSQFYICLAPQPALDGQYTVFGQTVEGMDVVQAIGKVKTDARDRPVEPVIMKKVTIFEAE